MIRLLFALYRRSPFFLRGTLGSAGRLLGLALRPVSVLRIGGYRMAVDFSDNACFKYAADRGGYEQTEVGTFLRAVEQLRDCVVVDVGANYGAYTLAACDLITRRSLPAEVVAIEPDRRPARALRRSIGLNGFDHACELRPVVAGAEEGSATIWVNARSSADNRTHAVTSSRITVRESYDVPVETIDSILARRHDHTPVVVKMDIQGNEPRAFRGMETTLREVERWVVLFEHAPYLIRSAGLDLEAYVDRLCGLPFEAAFRFTDDGAFRLEGRDGLRSLLLDVRRADGFHGEGAVADLMIVRGVRPDFVHEVRDEGSEG